jgi:hypothetical protein
MIAASKTATGDHKGGAVKNTGNVVLAAVIGAGLIPAAAWAGPRIWTPPMLNMPAGAWMSVAQPTVHDLRYTVLPASCTQTGGSQGTGGFNWTLPASSWEDTLENAGDQFLFDLQYRSPGDDRNSGATVNKSCTDYAGYADSWAVARGGASDIAFQLNAAFEGKGARILDLDVTMVNGKAEFTAVLVPNYGTAGTAWWWTPDIPYDQIDAWLDQLDGQLDGKSPARLIHLQKYSDTYAVVAVANLRPDAKPFWYGTDATIQDVANAINGMNDGVLKRLVELKVDGSGHLTYILTSWDPTKVAWWWFLNVSWANLAQFASTHNARIIDLEQWPGSPTNFAAVLLGNQ